MAHSKETWKQTVMRYSIRHQLRWKKNIVKEFVKNERSYYEAVLKYSRAHYMLYPYHLSDVLIKGLGVTAFKYYLEMLVDIMSNDKSYDSLPNFTAADCLRLTGIGRNQYLDMMSLLKQKQASKNLFNQKKQAILKEMLPKVPKPITIQHWWIANIGAVAEEDVQESQNNERSVIDLLIDEGPKQIGTLPKSSVESLYNRGLLYLEIPISNTDQIIVHPLQDFVMNRVCGDYFENLLYTVFVSLDERTTIEQLSKLLDIDIELVKQVVSMYIRLGLATNKNAEPLYPVSTEKQPPNISKRWHHSWLSDATPKTATILPKPDLAEIPGAGYRKRVAFLFDSSLAASLMMGNFNSQLKTHAVTMFEVGKLGEREMDNFIAELEKVDNNMLGEEAQGYFEQSITLRNTLRFLRYNKNFTIQGCDGGVELLRCERLNSIPHDAQLRLMNRNYGLLISMAPISMEKLTITCAIPYHFGPVIPEVNSIWFKLFIYHTINSGPDSILYPKGTRVVSLPHCFDECVTVSLESWEKHPIIIETVYLLPTLNEALLSSPVLIQAHTYKSLEMPKMLNISFPLSEETLSAPSESEYTQETLFTHPKIQRLGQELNLKYFCGFIKMIYLDYPQEVDSKSSHWVLQDLSFGIPLFNTDINREVCDKIERWNLFSEENLSTHSTKSRELSLKLLDFISNVNGTHHLLEYGVPLPTHIIFWTESGKIISE
eukprot:TRINITY_DN20001_c0_g1_i1.p1 TRINITY_DN20001_c0_g1~~TRINITY_DN20001_c0_g1_i1.p1  ORF type:complete len:752 (+),score=142.19 TRINITY_DN20001_c0_g1_i1:112-2256(+)